MSRTQRPVLLTLLPAIVVWALVAAACRPPSRQATPVATDDTLVYAPTVDVNTLDPHDVSTRQSEQVVQMVYNGLLKYDARMNLIGDLAHEWWTDADGVTWTFRLRSGVRFHDGSLLTATTVKRSFDRVRDPARGHVRQPLFTMIDRLEVVDPQTIQIITTHPFGALEPTLAHPAASIVNPAVAERAGPDYGRYAETTSGTGPYRVVRWQKDLELVLERHAGYWAEPARTHRIVYRPIPTTAARVVALEVGDVDVISEVPALDLARLETDPDVRVHKVLSANARGFAFNVTRGPLADRRVRQAIAHAIDRQAIVDGLMPGVATVSTGPLTPIMRGYADLGPIRHDPDRARRLLAEAGYPSGFATTITTSPYFPENSDVAEAVAAQLRAVGIDAAVDVLEYAIWRSRYRGVTAAENPLQIIYLGTGASTADADWGLRAPFFTHPTNEDNRGHYSNVEFDERVLAAMRELDPGRRQALYRRAQEIIYLEDPAAVWLYDTYFVVASRAGVDGLEVSPRSVVTFERAVVRRD